MENSVEKDIVKNRRVKVFWSNLFLGLGVCLFFLIMCCCVSLVDNTFETFISTIGVFFIPLLASLCALAFVSGVGFFRFVTLDHAKKMVMDVNKCNEVSVDGMNKILKVIDIEKVEENKRKEKIYTEISKQKHLEQKAQVEILKDLKKH